MRTTIGGTCLALFTAGGLAFVLAGRTHPSHAGPCLSGSCSAQTATVVRPPCGCDVDHDLTDVVDVAAEPRRLPFVNFTEPPLATVVPAGLTVPADGPARIPPAVE